MEPRPTALARRPSVSCIAIGAIPHLAGNWSGRRGRAVSPCSPGAWSALKINKGLRSPVVANLIMTLGNPIEGATAMFDHAYASEDGSAFEDDFEWVNAWAASSRPAPMAVPAASHADSSAKAIVGIPNEQDALSESS